MTQKRKVSRAQYNALLDGSQQTFYTNADLKAGDFLLLEEYNYTTGKLTGAELVLKITDTSKKPAFAIEVTTVLL